MHDWNTYWHGHSLWGDWLMVFLMLVFIVAVIVAIVFIVRALTRRGPTTVPAAQAPVDIAGTQAPGATTAAAYPSHAGPETPLAILQRRYAAGEIGRDEFLEKLQDLSQEGR
jgi:uncharacterized membrane protein